MMTKRRARRIGAIAVVILAALCAGGCSSDILNYNLRANVSSFLIGVFSDSVNAAVQSY